MKRQSFILFTMLILFFSCQDKTVHLAEKTEDKPNATRGYWLTNVDSKAMFSPDSLKKAVDVCAESGMNSIYAVTWNNGMTMYPSKVMEELTGQSIDPRVSGWDPLDTLIRYAHDKGIRVIGWFEFGFASAYADPTGGPILQKHPGWAALDRDGRIATKNNFQWMNALHPEVQDLLLSLVLEVIRNYDIDGIQGDDRLPAMPTLAGYDPYTTSMYRAEHNGIDPPDDPKDEDWIRWRADILNAFMERLHQKVREADPGITISMAPSIFPWSLEEYLQDWPAWVQNGWVDEIIPQVYRYDIGKYRAALHEIVEHQVSPENRHILFPGMLIKVGDYLADTNFISQMIVENRRHGLDGEVFFFYEGIVRQMPYFQKLAR